MSVIKSISSVNTSSPIRRTIQGSEPYAAFSMKADDMKKQLANELHCHWVGPMPVNSFFEAFLNIDAKDLRRIKNFPENYFDKMPHTTKEPELYQPFINLVTDSHIAPNLKLLDTSNHEDKDTETGMKNKPDVTAYDIKADVNPTRPTSYSQCEVIFEFKPKQRKDDPFADLSEEATTADLAKFIWEPTAEGRENCRGQIACYARAWMARQHRTHCFVVWIGDPYARIVRFDRSGAIVTERFDIRSKSRLLLEFLRRISCASPEMRGLDPTVSIATSKKEVDLAKRVLKKWTPTSDYTRDVLKLKVLDGGSAKDPVWREVLVWGPLADPQCVVGRATRGYPGWDLKNKELVFVKDSWRVSGVGISKKTDILKTLNAAEVCNVPQLVCGDDLPGQVTKTQDFVDADWNLGGDSEIFSKRIHIRFLSDLIGTRLTKFKTSEQFVRAWLDALLAHEEAYTKCKILHRDISLNNILLKPGGGGFLNDWDLAKTLDNIDAGPCQPSRSGTWQFMSANLLGRLDKKHTLQDDLEAFFWVLLYVAIRYLSTSISESGESIPFTMKLIFDVALDNGKVILGGSVKKEVVMESKHLGDEFSVTGNIPLSDLIDDILIIMRPYFEYWQRLHTEVKSLARKQGISLAAARELYLAPEKQDKFEFSKHKSMIALARKSLTQKWPTKEPAEDRCARPSKRPVEDSGAGTKRSRND